MYLQTKQKGASVFSHFVLFLLLVRTQLIYLSEIILYKINLMMFGRLKNVLAQAVLCVPVADFQGYCYHKVLYFLVFHQALFIPTSILAR